MTDPEPKPIVLVIDDDTLVMRSVTSALGAAGYRVLAAQDGQTGLALFAEHADEICLVLTDIAMPVMGGLRMAEEILNRRPGTKILLMTGYNDIVIESNSLKLPLIRKPFLPADLIRKIKAVLGNDVKKIC
jgi:two-component system, cell cycle sensor histidine kinase and response regulator CckA